MADIVRPLVQQCWIVFSSRKILCEGNHTEHLLPSFRSESYFSLAIVRNRTLIRKKTNVLFWINNVCRAVNGFQHKAETFYCARPFYKASEMRTWYNFNSILFLGSLNSLIACTLAGSGKIFSCEITCPKNRVR